MPRGGARLGAGRPKKSQIQARVDGTATVNGLREAVAFEFLTGAVLDADLPFESRLKAAAILLPFEKRRIRPLQPLGRKERAEEAAVEAATGPYAPSLGPQPRSSRPAEPDLGIYEPPAPPKGFRN